MYVFVEQLCHSCIQWFFFLMTNCLLEMVWHVTKCLKIAQT